MHEEMEHLTTQCYRYFWVLRLQATNIHNSRDSLSLNWLLQPLREKGQRITAPPRKSLSKTTQNRTILSQSTCSMYCLRLRAGRTLGTCAARAGGLCSRCARAGSDKWQCCSARWKVMESYISLSYDNCYSEFDLG